MYRGNLPIPRDQMIPLTEEGVRSYDEVKNIVVIDTTVERLRGCFQLLVAHNPLFNLTRGEVPEDAVYEVTILSPAEGILPTVRLKLSEGVRSCVIRSVGPVEDRGRQNTSIEIDPETTVEGRI